MRSRRRRQGSRSFRLDLFGRPVDLARIERLRREYRPYVEKDIAMDESGRPVRDWRIPLQDMIRFGEAANRIPQEIRDADPEIDWQGIRSARDLIAHEYDRVDEDAVWNIVRAHIPALLPQLRALPDAKDRAAP